jgi:hypothetical protein
MKPPAIATRAALGTIALAGLLAAQVKAPPAAPTAPVAIPPLTELSGRIDRHDGLVVLHTWGTAGERGYAHGRLLANEFAATALPEFDARFGRRPALLAQVRAAIPRLIEYPDDVRQQLDGLWRGLGDSGVSLRLPELDRPFDFVDLQLANALDVFGLMGCSSFVVAGEQVEGGGVLSARNFDWPLTGPHLVRHTILAVEHLADGRATAAVTWPGYLGAVTGINSDGVAAYLHVGTGVVTYSPEPSSWPSAIALAVLLAKADGREAAATFALAKEQLSYTSPPAGYLTHLVLPRVPSPGRPAVVFEADAQSVEQAAVADGPCVLTNHFRHRRDGRPASNDSLDRERALTAGIVACAALGAGDRKVDIDEAWRLLAEVERGGKQAFGTLHSLVFRHEPWHFELRLAEHGDGRLVAAPSSGRRHRLMREQLFAPSAARPR